MAWKQSISWHCLEFRGQSVTGVDSTSTTGAASSSHIGFMLRCIVSGGVREREGSIHRFLGSRLLLWIVSIGFIVVG
jgi:hypothetical protein